MTRNPDSEDALESAVMDLFAELGYETINVEYESVSDPAMCCCCASFRVNWMCRHWR